MAFEFPQICCFVVCFFLLLQENFLIWQCNAKPKENERIKSNTHKYCCFLSMKTVLLLRFFALCLLFFQFQLVMFSPLLFCTWHLAIISKPTKCVLLVLAASTTTAKSVTITMMTTQERETGKKMQLKCNACLQMGE